MGLRIVTLPESLGFPDTLSVSNFCKPPKTFREPWFAEMTINIKERTVPLVEGRLGSYCPKYQLL